MENIVKGAADNNLNNGNLLIYIDNKDDVPQLVQVKKGIIVGFAMTSFVDALLTMTLFVNNRLTGASQASFRF
ncbi:MAG: hypothetical protein LBD80_09855 [Tannerella sp.]|jgi:hypothetical protein|nr:hypothetical protein [Tannerella sp.]